MQLVILFENLKLLKKIELVFGIAGILSIVLSLIRFPFGDELLIISFGLLTIYYIFLGVLIYKFDKLDSSGTKFSKFVLSFYACNSYAVCLLGILYKLLLWPYAKEMMLVGFVSIVLIFLILIGLWLVFRSIYLKSHLITSFLCLLLCTSFYIVSFHTIIDIRYINNPECGSILKQSYDDPQNEKLRNQASECKYKHNYK
jgi:hypothetical protein